MVMPDNRQFSGIADLKAHHTRHIFAGAMGLPNFPRANDITLDEMLHHTSGIFYHTSAPYFSVDGMIHIAAPTKWLSS